MKSGTPLEIIGGGLAGLSLGLALRKADIAVTLYEAGEYPRHRVCGEFIAGLADSTIERLGLAPMLDDSLRHREIAWFVRENLARVQQLPSPALGISRHCLDARLAEAFQAAGGTLHTRARVTELEARPGRIYATGRRRTKSDWVGLKFHVQNLSLTRELELHLGEHAYVGLAQIEAGRVNVCGLFRRRPLCAKGSNLLLGYLQAAGLRALAERISAGAPDPATHCAVAGVGFDSHVPEELSRLSLGDAGSMIPPFTGNGMAMAFQSAELALDPLIDYARGETNWADTCRHIHARLSRQFRIRLASAHVFHSFLLHPPQQRVLSALTRSRLLPLRPLYQLLH